MTQLTIEGDYFLCPNCGAEVRKGQAACPACGSCDETGWSEAATEGYADGGYEEDDEFDYDDFIQREFHHSGSQLNTKGWALAIVVVLVCLALALTAVFSR